VTSYDYPLFFYPFTLFPFRARRARTKDFWFSAVGRARLGLAPCRKWLGGRTARVLRGASWNNNEPRNLLSSNRNNNTPDNRNDNNGFRVVLVFESEGKWRHRKMGAMPGGRTVCPARAKRSPNPPGHAPEEPGKRRGAGRGL